MICYEINHDERKKRPEMIGTYFGLAYCMTNKECDEFHKKIHLTTILNMWDYAKFLRSSYGKKESTDN